MRRLRSGRAKTSWFFRFLSEKGFWALDRAWKFRRGTRIRTNSRKSRTASIPAALDFRTPPGHPPLEKSRAGRRTTTHCCESAYRQLHFWDRNRFLWCSESNSGAGVPPAPCFVSGSQVLLVTRTLSCCRPGEQHRPASAAPAALLCAGHVQQFGGASPPANLMEVKA
jgi:hypothetical protein